MDIILSFLFKHLVCVALFSVAGINSACAQTGWTWNVLDTMPIRLSNNSVANGTVLADPYAFSFGGIDSTKLFSGITNRAFRYEFLADNWDEISPLPVTLPLIASSASTVKNKIYIIGGYHVYSNGSETSSNEIIIYNPETNVYEPNGTSIPIPIDDHSQCVWRDSLIYVITGWSNSTNVPNIQIYNPSFDTWSTGTSLPNLSTYKVFGSSGYIIGDTIFYFGGASTGVNFPASKKLRKGVINPTDPTIITWSLESDAPNTNYRSACVNYENNVYWIGGSSVSYNYDAIAYNGTGGVIPLNQIMRYDTYSQGWYDGFGAPYSVMDLRGAAKISNTTWIICGGMNENQDVTNRTFLLTFDPIVGTIVEQKEIEIKIIGNEIIVNSDILKIELISSDGKIITVLNQNETRVPDFISGFIIVKVYTSEGNCSIQNVFQ